MLGLQLDVSLIQQNLGTGIMHEKVILVASGKLIEQLSKLLERVEQADTSTPVEVVRLDEPHVLSIVHFFSQLQLFMSIGLVLEVWL